MFIFHHVTVGGTFDHFHLGHRTFLEKAFAVGDVVWLGVTTGKFLSTLPITSAKTRGDVESYAVRINAVQRFLNDKDWSGRAKIIPIDDRFGTTLTDKNLEAIIVSPETELVATEINLVRIRKNWPAMEVVVVPWVKADDGNPVNSVRIRRGEIDREGRPYRLPDDWGVRRLPENLRPELHRPFGRLLSNIDNLQPTTYNLQLLISVGDAVTKNLLKNDLTPNISIVDFKIQRKTVYKNIEEFGFRDIKVFKNAKNNPGTVSFAAYKNLLSLIKNEAKPSVLQINGEEDLMTLLAIFLAPLNSLIVYGQPNEGIVVVEVTEEKKHTARNFLDRFIPI